MGDAITTAFLSAVGVNNDLWLKPNAAICSGGKKKTNGGLKSGASRLGVSKMKKKKSEEWSRLSVSSLWAEKRGQRRGVEAGGGGGGGVGSRLHHAGSHPF